MIVGPIDPSNGFPMWYKDKNGIRLALNTNAFDPLSILSPQDLPDPARPVSFPDNFPSEAFYMLAEAQMTTGTGERALLVLALEGAFSDEIPREGDQMVFGRVRIRVSGLRANEEYIVTHPYGTDTFIAEVADEDEPEVGEIRFSEDIGDVQDFESALASRIHPFLQWDPEVAPSAPAGYIGDPAVPHPIVGSLFTDETGAPQNIFRIRGPGIGIGSPDASVTPGFDPADTIETRLFTLAGKLSTVSGLDIERANYSRTEERKGFIDVFVTSDSTPQDIQVSGQGVTPAGLIGGNGVYFARTEFEGTNAPDSIKVTNASDSPPTVKIVQPVDFVWAEAIYDTDALTLTVIASSSDEIGNPELTISDFGNGVMAIPEDGTLTVPGITLVPPVIRIVSSAGGSAEVSVVITGENTDPFPVSANAGNDQTVLWGSNVTLDGSGSTGAIDSYNWVQIDGEPVVLTGADTVQPTFTAPSLDTSLEFELTVTGPEGNTATDTVTITVSETVPAPVADAGPDQLVSPGTQVTLRSRSTGVISDYNWSQVAGPPVTLTDPDTPVSSFAFPNQQATLIFELTVIGPGGSSSDSVEISSAEDILSITRAEFRTRDAEWRISGTTTATSGVTVTIYLGEDLNGTVLAEAIADNLGEWEFRIEGSSMIPDASRSISVQSSAGGTLLDIPINIRQ
ncbi:PKD domain-containing protein [Bacillus sp. SCS-153A]|uniref:PKD domain-containing protein n=1 Tax=Rossellomorea sedimentorum TaxID=3115294 RepID=UPI0039058F54